MCPPNVPPLPVLFGEQNRHESMPHEPHLEKETLEQERRHNGYAEVAAVREQKQAHHGDVLGNGWPYLA